MIMPLTFMPISKADTATVIPTFLMLNVSPNPIGIGQTALLNVFLTKPPVTGGLGGSGTMYQDIKILVTHPDGTTETLGPLTSDSTGGTWVNYIPTKTGNYTFKASYPGQHIEEYGAALFGPPPFYNVTYLASESVTYSLTVQSQPIQYYSGSPLPTSYWTRPIYATNYAWAQLGGSWYGLAAPAFATTGSYDATGNFQPYTTAPNTGHIMWTKPTTFGGLVGSPITNDQMSNYMSTTIASNFFEPIILNGVLYYTVFASADAIPSSWVAVDLRTGQTLWTRTAGQSGNEILRMGEILRWHSIQEYGSWAYLYSVPSSGGSLFGVPAYMSIYDAATGEYMANITNLQSASFITDTQSEQEGSLLGYYISGGNLTLWNSTTLMMSNSWDHITIRARGTYDWSAGIQWSVPIPSEVAGGFIAAVTHDVILVRYAPSSGMFSSLSYGSQTTAGFDAITGALLWGPSNQTIPNMHDISMLGAYADVYVLHDKDTNQAYGYSMKTGNEIWGPVTLPGNAWSSISVAAQSAYGRIYIFDFGGYVNALDLTTGKIDWTYTPQSAGYNSGLGVYPLWYNGMISDGKLFISQSHMYDPPMFPGAQQLALNCTTGKVVWSLLSFTGRVPTASADGYLIQWNSYDCQIYSIGKGPSKLTLTAPSVGVTTATPITISGTITDISAGSKQDAVASNFPNGLPCVSDASMSAWMEYVYMQQPFPTNATGVPITLSVLDRNGNSRVIGTTTSDTSGSFAYTWTPDISGNFTLTASFAGSESYYQSSAEAHFYAGNTVSTMTPTATPINGLASNTTVMYAVVAMIIVFIVGIALVALLVTRKHP